MIMKKMNWYICCHQSSNRARGIAPCRSRLTSASHSRQSIIHVMCCGCWMVTLRCYLPCMDGCLFCWRAAYKWVQEGRQIIYAYLRCTGRCLGSEWREGWTEWWEGSRWGSVALCTQLTRRFVCCMCRIADVFNGMKQKINEERGTC